MNDLTSFLDDIENPLLDGSISITVNESTYAQLQSEADWFMAGAASLSWGCAWAEFPPADVACVAGIALGTVGGTLWMLMHGGFIKNGGN